MFSEAIFPILAVEGGITRQVGGGGGLWR